MSQKAHKLNVNTCTFTFPCHFSPLGAVAPRSEWRRYNFNQTRNVSKFLGSPWLIWNHGVLHTEVIMKTTPRLQKSTFTLYTGIFTIFTNTFIGLHNVIGWTVFFKSDHTTNHYLMRAWTSSKEYFHTNWKLPVVPVGLPWSGGCLLIWNIASRAWIFAQIALISAVALARGFFCTELYLSLKF